MVNDFVWYREEKVIRDLIQEFEADPKRMEMLDGERYYRNEGDILDRQQFFWDENHERQVDTTKPNNRIPHAFMKLLVDEKVGYFLGNPPNITAENADMQEKLISAMDEEFDDIMADTCTEASNKGISWLYVYIEPVEKGIGPLRFEIIPAEQVIPIWGDRSHRDLVGVINYYYMPEFDLETGKQTDVLKVECWHPDGVVFYTEFDGKLVEDIGRMYPGLQERELPETGLSHFIANGKEYNWGQVPFIPFRNNSMELSDLRFVRGLIDAYDKGVSDLANMMEELKKVILVLKNYQGTNLREFMDNLRFFGAVKTDEDGGVDKLDMSFSLEAPNTYLDRLKKDLYQSGQGVDMDTDKFGQNPSGVALEFLYSGLKLKTDNLERKFKLAFKRLFQLCCVYLSSTGQGNYDWKLAKVTFNRSEISNVLDMIEAVNSSTATISRKTAIARHPWVDDVDLELEQIDEEDQISLDRVPTSDETEEDDETEEQGADGGAERPNSGGGDG